MSRETIDNLAIRIEKYVNVNRNFGWSVQLRILKKNCVHRWRIKFGPNVFISD